MPSRPARTARSSSRSSRRSDAAPGAADHDVVAVGQITGAHGLRGLLRVRAFQPDSPSLAAGRMLLLEHGGSRRDVRVTSAAAHGPTLLVGLEGVADRTAAEALRGASLLVRRADLPPAGPDEFYDYEVTDFAVDTTDGRRLGTIVETLDNGLHGVWTVRDGEREVLIPVIADVVREIDRAARRVVIDPLPGLLD